MNGIPEIPCACGQHIAIDRAACPYCGAPVKSYWFYDQGRTQRAVPFVDNGEECLWINGKRMAVDAPDIPDALRNILLISTKPGFGAMPVSLSPEQWRQVKIVFLTSVLIAVFILNVILTRIIHR